MTAESKERVEHLFSDQRSGLLTAKEYSDRLRQLIGPELIYLSKLTSQCIKDKGLGARLPDYPR